MSKILIMDDDPIIVAFLTNLLREEGYDVISAEDGSEGLELARRQKPDLILSDLVMPYKDGFEILRELKSDPALREIPVIVVSMKEKEQDVVRGFDLGANDYIVKPFGAHELLARVRRTLSGGKGEGGAGRPEPNARGSGKT
jgi:DNA-binding response OmpR family regulator